MGDGKFGYGLLNSIHIQIPMEVSITDVPGCIHYNNIMFINF